VTLFRRIHAGCIAAQRKAAKGETTGKIEQSGTGAGFPARLRHSNPINHFGFLKADAAGGIPHAGG